MSKFMSEFHAELKQGSDIVRVMTGHLIYDSDLVGKILIKTGFETDYASVPRIPVIYALWGNRAHRGATIHDFLFRIDSVPNVSWMMANRVFLEVMKVRGKPWYIRYPMFWGVCAGSYGCYHKRLVDDEIG